VTEAAHYDPTPDPDWPWKKVLLAMLATVPDEVLSSAGLVRLDVPDPPGRMREERDHYRDALFEAAAKLDAIGLLARTWEQYAEIDADAAKEAEKAGRFDMFSDLRASVSRFRARVSEVRAILAPAPLLERSRVDE
jgi:hypothetical protein